MLNNTQTLTQAQKAQVILTIMQSPSCHNKTDNTPGTPHQTNAIQPTTNNINTQAQSPAYTSFSQELGGNAMSPEQITQAQHPNFQEQYPQIDISKWRV